MRNYSLMREILGFIDENEEKELEACDFSFFKPHLEVKPELYRLDKEGLIASTFVFNGKNRIETGSVKGLTAKGEEFYRLIVNDRVWRLIRSTLQNANIDASYPLLKKVCEKIVEQYILGYIPHDKQLENA